MKCVSIKEYYELFCDILSSTKCIELQRRIIYYFIDSFDYCDNNKEYLNFCFKIRFLFELYMYNGIKQDILTMNGGYYNIKGFEIKKLSVLKFLTLMDEYFTETDDLMSDSHGEFKRDNDDTNKIINDFLYEYRKIIRKYL
jgi:hypothetical protein